MRADRLIRIMTLLQRRGKTPAYVLARELGVARRTIYRDLDALTLAGVPVYSEGGPGGGVWLDEDYRVSLTGLKPDELSALFAGAGAGPLADLGLAGAAEGSLLKLYAALPSLQQGAVERFRERVYLDPVGWWPGESTGGDGLKLLQEACFAAVEVTLVYERNDGQVVTRTVQPMGLVAKGSVWYLVAGSAGGELRTYRVGRVQSVTVSAQAFARPAGFDLAEWWAAHSTAFVGGIPTYAYTLRVRSTRLRFVRLYVAGQVDVVDGGGEWVTVRIVTGEEAAAVMTVLGLGQDCEVVSPEGLKVAVRQTGGVSSWHGKIN